jgi:hypothetical protein
MAILNRNDITNLYLYGQLTTPVNLLDSSLIRPKDTAIRVNVDAEELMEGPGRFAVGSQFELIKRFFNSNISISPGTYTKSKMNELILEADFIGWKMKQYNYNDNLDDYLDRVWVYNSMAFKISYDAEFIVEPNGERKIENFAIEPFINEDRNKVDNFDFGSGDGLTSILNAFAGPQIDPSGIGREVFLDYIDANLIPRIIYTQNLFSIDLEASQFWYINDITMVTKINSTKDTFIDGLFNDGVIKFLDGNKPIIYGTVEDDLYFSAAYVSKFSHPTLYNYKKNGLVMIGGGGGDTITGYINNDKLLGGTGKDNLEGNGGADTLEGGSGNDTLNGGSGDQDIAVFSDKFENYKYTISDSGLFGLGGKIITFTHNKGTQADALAV